MGRVIKLIREFYKGSIGKPKDGQNADDKFYQVILSDDKSCEQRIPLLSKLIKESC